MKVVISITDAIVNGLCRVVTTLQSNLAGGLVLVLLVGLVVAAGVTWRR